VEPLMRRQILNITVTWFCLGLLAGTIFGAAACQPEPTTVERTHQ
jgi:hypothetical protein